MYLHLGGETIVRKSAVLGIFDLDNASVSHITRDYLKAAEKRGAVVPVTGELPKSFVIAGGAVYLSQLSSATLAGRL